MKTRKRHTPSPTARRSRIVVFPLIGALVLFFGPAVGFVLGDRATPIDNRPLSSFPSVDDGWKFLPKFQAWANDYLPLRALAVKADTKISERVFGEAPRFSSGGVGVAGVANGTGSGSGSAAPGSGVKYPQVLTGRNGWLFYGSDIEAPCKPQEDMATIVAGFQKLSDAAAQSGRKMVIVIAPDKSSAHPELMPDTYAGKACMQKQKTAFWAATKKLTGPGLVDPKADLAAFEKNTGRSAWRKFDTHWDPEGSAVFSTLVASQLDPSLLSSTTVVPGPEVQSEGDLSAMVGDPKSEPVVSVTIQRPGVQLYSRGKPIGPDKVPDLGYSPLTITAKSTGAALYQPKTVLLGDSFFEASRSELAPFFRSLTYVHNMSGDIPGATATLAAEIADSDTIVYELVERAAAGGYVSYQHPANFDALAAAMLKNPRK
ncbi:alginate O-acetyltransferase AlgX-related protein [Lacisediminihabitans profunda]|uniref:AlgX/AlgJ SGNH hydrolase-like domain-containing protein n=1 Tax=Lacisediminihabitans profunda TaxID=2594790 RepID=A0A5C8UJ81_9MICO|nr:hypothetical protein [Lacisediminihabitans profunda]TXN28228.1 hypothetical protein FVP33_17270 [Lacisediminihabitans profunda]